VRGLFRGEGPLQGRGTAARKKLARLDGSRRARSIQSGLECLADAQEEDRRRLTRPAEGIEPAVEPDEPDGALEPEAGADPLAQVETAQAVGRGVDIADVVEDDSAAKARPSTRPISSTVTGTAIG